MTHPYCTVLWLALSRSIAKFSRIFQEFASMKAAERTLKSMQLALCECFTAYILIPDISLLVGDLSSLTPNAFCVQYDLGDHGSLLNLSFAQTVLPSLLILCGDVESNPGPGSKSKNLTVLYINPSFKK